MRRPSLPPRTLLLHESRGLLILFHAFFITLTRRFQMKLHRHLMSIAISLMAGSAIAAGSLPITLAKDVEFKKGGETWPVISIASKANKIVIQKITLNRGKCQWEGLMYMGLFPANSMRPKLPVALGFGDKVTYVVCDNIIEATIETDKGSATYSWDQ
jgi:hypothetical protein